MEWVLQNKVWILALVIVGLFLLLVPILFRDWVTRRMGRGEATRKAQQKTSNVHPFPSRGTPSTLAPEPVQAPPANLSTNSAAAAAGQTTGAGQGARGDGLSQPDYNETPTPFAIIAEVCSLQPPVRETVEESYRGMDVRWKLRLVAVSEGVERGPVRSVRMYPDSRSAQSCGIYFVVNLADHPDLETARRDEAFVVEATIENVSGTDIDLKNVRKVVRAA
jgi:hypothetical protein